MADDEHVLGGHVLLEVVGRGADSIVHRARQRDRSGRIVAVKRLRVGADPAAVVRLRREADLLTGLSHPAVVPLLEVLDDPAGGVALVLPWAPGGSLEDVLRREGSLPWPRVADIGARLASALASAHAAGVLHRDVKPANVLLGVEDEPRLADFGTALLRAADAGEVVGTAEYLDPAVAVDGEDPSGRSDGYALGVLLYRALSGRLPHAGGSPEATVAAAARGVHPPLADLVPEAPPDLVAAIERAMARAPSERFASVQQLQVALEAVVRAHDVEAWDRLGAQLVAPGTDEPPAPPAPPAPSDAPAGPVQGDSGTRMFGPRPPAEVDEDDDGGGRRWAAPALVAVLLVPLVALAWLVLLRGDDGAAPSPADTAAPSAAAATVTPRTPPERCDGATAPPTDGEVLEADVDGRGCALPLVLTEEDLDDGPALVLAVPEAAGDLAGRYAVGVPGDRVVTGDWDCDGSESPAVVREDGTTYLFDGYGALEPRAGPTLAAGAEPRVVTDADGCDEVVAED